MTMEEKEKLDAMMTNVGKTLSGLIRSITEKQIT
jgi:predicted DNA-binding protein